MRLRQSSKVALLIGAGAAVCALGALVLIRPPAMGDQMALPDRTSAAIVRNFAKKVVAEIVALATPAAPKVDLDYDIELVRSGESDVPQVFHASLPPDLTRTAHAPLRKDRFLALVLPLVLKTNQDIAEDRARLMQITEAVRAGRRVSAEDQVWVEWIAERYDARPDELDKLLRRVDIIPPSLALAQAAEESGWGTSRFAYQGNALFGQRTYGDQPGLTPTGAAAENFRVRTYENLGDAVEAYAHNLNTHPAYAPFRTARAQLRAEGDALAGHALALTLTRYSERGADYVASLRAIIRLNRLDAFDKARLDTNESVAKL